MRPEESSPRVHDQPVPPPRRVADCRADDLPAEERVATARDELTRRLRPVCADMPPAEFDALVELMARRALRWRSADGGWS